MKQYQVTLNFTFTPHGYVDEDKDDFNSDTESVHSHDSATSQNEEKLKSEAFRRTDKYYEKHSITKYIKTNDAYGFVESLLSDGEVLSAEWDKKKFAIHMVVDSYQTPEHLQSDLRNTSLEDGEYEACGETGWIVMTRGPNNEVFDYPWDTSQYWEYGLTDYRSNPIQVRLLGEKPEIPECEELFTLTEKGKALYIEVAKAREKGLRLNQADSKKFWLMRKLMKDPRLYPVGIAN